MNKIQTSILVIGFQQENQRMYPHLYDCLQNLRQIYDDVIYIGDGGQGELLHLIDSIVYKIKHNKPDNTTPTSNGGATNISITKILDTLHIIFIHALRHYKLIQKLKTVRFKHNKYLVLAIDHTSYYIAEKYFPNKVIFWSYDILTKDYSMRIKDGFLDKLITSHKPIKAKALIIQDKQRKQLLEEATGTTFPTVIYLPVSLNDSEFCRKAARDRQDKQTFPIVNIVQSGWIIQGRLSNELIKAYQHWPNYYKLTLRGFIYPDAIRELSQVARKPEISQLVCGSNQLPEILDRYDIGFVAYGNKDSNHKYIENASAQMVDFLRLGIPVIGCGSSVFNDFITKQNIGIGITSIDDMGNTIQQIAGDYPFYSRNARKLYELRYNLTSQFDYLVKSLEPLF